MLLDGVFFATVAVLVLWLAGLTYWVSQTVTHYKKLTRNAQGEDLQKILQNILASNDNIKSNVGKVEQDLEILEKSTHLHIQKVAAMRFNPYSETGGDQSFALALLNKLDTGIVLLSLHGREGTRLYVKPVKEGKSQYDLSREEQQVLAQAKKGK